MRQLLVLIFCLLGVPGLTSAQIEGYDPLVKSALEAYDNGRFVEARSLFKRAHAVSPSARTLRGVGMCSFNLGDYVDAMLYLEAALDDASRPLSAEQRAAADELVDRASRKVGRFRVQLTPAEARVSVDGEAAVRSVRGDILVEPGRHELQVSAPGYRSAQRTLSVDPGDRAALEVRLEENAEQGAVAVAPASDITAVPISADDRAFITNGAEFDTRHLTAKRFGITALSVGAAGLAAFAVAGSMALSSKDELGKACRNHDCPAAKYDDIDAYNRQKIIASVGLYAGAALLTAGVATLVWRARVMKVGHASITPLVGLSFVGLRGTL